MGIPVRLEDYEVEVDFRDPAMLKVAGVKVLPWIAGLKKWPAVTLPLEIDLMPVLGNTREEAVENLKCGFLKYRRDHKTLPEPKLYKDALHCRNTVGITDIGKILVKALRGNF